MKYSVLLAQAEGGEIVSFYWQGEALSPSHAETRARIDWSLRRDVWDCLYIDPDDPHGDIEEWLWGVGGYPLTQALLVTNGYNEALS